MAVILKKKKVQEESASSSALSFNALVTGMRRLPAVTVVSGVGGLVLVAGFVAGANSDDLPSRAQPVASGAASTTPAVQASAKPADAQKEVSELNNQASKVMAALLAYKQEKGALAGKVAELLPRHLSPADGAEKWATKWSIEGYSLLAPGLSESACRLLSGGKLTPIDHGRTGLQCVSENGVHKGVYRIDAGEPPLKGFWKFDIEGKLSGKLSTWKVTGAETFVHRCNGDNVNAGKAATQWTQEVELHSKSSLIKRTLCLPVYEQEVTPVEQGMSLLEGNDRIYLSGVANEQPWSLSVSAQACDFGARVSATISLRPAQVPASSSKVSCDLRKL